MDRVRVVVTIRGARQALVIPMRGDRNFVDPLLGSLCCVHWL
jgi:hypothetical protein